MYAEKIKEAVKQASKLYSKATSGILVVDEKGDKTNLVTQYDKAIQEELSKTLIEMFRGEFPDIAVIGEEGEGSKAIPKSNCFIIDPIDGTTNFIHNYLHSAISVAFVKEGTLEAGVVFDVDKNLMFSAERNCGAFLNGDKINVSKTHLDHALVQIGTSPYNRELTDRTFELAKKVYEKAIDIRRSGSAALDICYVASGKSDLYFELNTYPWDWAAASLILKEAGGVITNLKNAPLATDGPDSIVCGNPLTHKEFFELIK